MDSRNLYIIYFYGALFLSFVWIPETHANIVTAKSCSQSDVSAAVNATRVGDTVSVPAGTCTWDNSLLLSDVAITIQGAGVDQTTIINGSSTIFTLFKIVTTEGKSLRITGFTFKDTGKRAFKGLIDIRGNSKAWRVDHSKFDHLGTVNITVGGDTAGVVDHDEFFMTGGNISIQVYHPTWDNMQFGDGSWASPLNLGGWRAVFVEDNIFNYDGTRKDARSPDASRSGGRNSWAIDASRGGRYIFRYNTLTNMTVAHHGTEGTPNRGTFSYEIYNNTFIRTLPERRANVIHSRSGTGVVFNNIVTGPYGSFITIANHRDFHSYSPWGACDGRSPYDINDKEKIYDSGTSSNTASTSAFVTDETKNWTTNQWVGYSVIDNNTNMGNVVTSNTTTTLYVYQDPDAKQAKSVLTINPGDKYIIMRALVCLDQTGRSTGALISRPASHTSPSAAWPKEALEPLYAWNNTFNSVKLTDSTSPPGIKGTQRIIEGRDFYSNTVRPGYTPYTYPHPLVTGATGSSVPTVPSSSQNSKNKVK